MKAYLLYSFFMLSILSARAQNNPVNNLPAGKYETVVKNQDKWDRGDIILMDANKYKVSTSNEIGEYRFSITAQRVFFTSGPLKSFYAKTSSSTEGPAIVLPVSENQQLKARDDVWGYYRQ